MGFPGRRRCISEMDRALNSVKWILDDLTPQNILLCTVAIGSFCSSAEILEEVTSLIYDKAVVASESIPLYAQLCGSLSPNLPEFPAEDPDGKLITFKRLLLNTCHKAFEGAYNSTTQVKQTTALNQVFHFKYKERMAKRQALGNVCLIGELYKQRLVPEKIIHHIVRELLSHYLTVFPAEENVEAVCLLLKIVGKQFDESPRSRDLYDAHYNILKDLNTNPQLAPHLRVMVLNVIDLRANNWVSKHEGVKDQTITENNHGASACSSNPQCMLSVTSVAQENTEAAPPIDNSVLKRKTFCLLEEYFSVRLLEEALQRIVELKSPSYHPEIIKEAISMGLQKYPPCNEPVSNLLEYLLAKNVITLNDVAEGFVSYGSIIDDVSNDFRNAPHSFGKIMGRLVFAGGLKFDVVGEVVKKSKYFKMGMLKATLDFVSISLAKIVV